MPRSSLRSKFLDHPASVGETYGQHLRSAFRFGGALLAAGMACLVHGMLPWIWKSRGSDTVRFLHERMAARRGK